jgi:ribosome biogenesis GTPase
MARRRLTHRQRERIAKIQENRRRRTVQRAGRQAEQLSEDGLSPEQDGLVIANYGPAAIVEDRARALHRCAVRQNLGTLVCGDQVIWQSSGTEEGVVVAVQERRSLLTRPDYSGRLRPLAANLDQVVVVVASRPVLSESLIDRYLIAIARIGVTPLLVLNKIDLPTADQLETVEAQLAGYRRIGYRLLRASTRTSHGLDGLRDQLRERTSILVGQSGVGKSSLIRTLLPDREIRIKALSEATGHGTHTTTTSMLYHLPDGGDLIDSPGVRSFEPGDVTPEELERGFVEFSPFLGHCRFSNCGHTVEPGCALREAVERGEVESRRLESYLQIKSSLTRS